MDERTTVPDHRACRNQISDHITSSYFNWNIVFKSAISNAVEPVLDGVVPSSRAPTVSEG